MTTLRLLRMNVFTTLLTGLATPLAAQPAGLQFDGNDDMVVADGTALNAIGGGDFTIEAWVKGNEADMPSHGCLFSNRGGGAGMMFFIHSYWGGSQSKLLALQMANSNYMLVDNGSLNGPVLDGTCHHVAVARMDDSLYFYVDGVHIGSREIFTAPPSVANPGTPLRFGVDPVSGNPFEGSLGHVRIWNVARSAQQIAAAHQQFVAPNTPGLVAYWLMNEGSGQIVNDLAGGDNGLLGGQATAQPSDPTWGAVGCAVQGVGMEELGAGMRLDLFPNPSRDQVTLTWPGADGAVQVLDASGRSVMENTLRGGKIILDIRELAPGPYTVRIMSANGPVSARLVKD